MDVIGLLLAIFEAIPIVDGWFQALVREYVKRRIARMKAENLDAIRLAIEEHDQRGLEKAIGNPRPGEPSNLPGVEIHDSLPGVKP